MTTALKKSIAAPTFITKSLNKKVFYYDPKTNINSHEIAFNENQQESELLKQTETNKKSKTSFETYRLDKESLKNLKEKIYYKNQTHRKKRIREGKINSSLTNPK